MGILRVASIASLALATASSAYAFQGTLTFSNQTVAAGIDVKYLPGTFVSSEYIAPGACGDFNGDGFQDLFLPSGGGSNGPDRLYMNQQNGTFVDQAAAWGLTTVHRATGLAVGDYDNDGYIDVYEASAGASGSGQIGQNKLYRNLNGTSFTNVAAAAGVTGVAGDSFGSSFGDYDIDGDLDLWVPGFNTHKNRLYKNNANGTFTDVTTAAGLSGAIASVFGFASRFVDTNGDHYPELLISGDFGTSRYFRNNGNGTFTNLTGASGTGKDENGMGGTVGDFDRDGRVDWYVASILADNPGTGWTGNKLYLNQGGHIFTEVAKTQGVWNGGYGWGSVGVDFNHDRWLDIGETNGAQWSSEWINERSYLWLNQGNGTYVESSAAVGFNDFDQGRGMLNFDYDNDGDQDIVVLGNNEKAKLWRNDLTGTNIHWLRVFLDTSGDPSLAPNGYGSVVRVTAGGIQQMGGLYGGDNLQSQSELAVHFGLGAATIIDTLTVEWNDGRVTTLNNVPVDQKITVSITKPWTNLGGGIPGSNGALTLTGTGNLMANSPTTIALTGAVPGAPGILFVGLAPLNAPLFGGVFWPTPDILINFNADGGGGLTLPVPWPPGIPSGFKIWMQTWFVDGGAPHGVAASNGLRATTP